MPSALYQPPDAHPPRWAVAVVAASAPIVIIAVALVVLFNPLWIGFAQDRAGVAAITGYSAGEVRSVTDAILADVTLGPPAFLVAVNGQAVLGPAERAHMVDVYNVIRMFALVAVVAFVSLVTLLVRHRAETWPWRAVSRSGAGLVLAGVTLSGMVIFLFDQVFLLFHLVFFPQGNFAFDPRTERLTQLFPNQFWTESAMAAVLTATVLALLVTALGRRLARKTEAGGVADGVLRGDSSRPQPHPRS